MKLSGAKMHLVPNAAFNRTNTLPSTMRVTGCVARVWRLSPIECSCYFPRHTSSWACFLPRDRSSRHPSHLATQTAVPCYLAKVGIRKKIK